MTENERGDRKAPIPSGLCEALDLTVHLRHFQVGLGGFFIDVNQPLAMRFKIFCLSAVLIAF